ncbi:MAG: 5-(carboxyamino)imidazole ribonucleotide synthase [Gemmatimonadales bacterium]
MYETFDGDILAFSAGGKATVGVGPRLGIIGGGQLARMTAMAALQLGCDVIILERNRYSPAATLGTHSLVGDWSDAGALQALADGADVIALENEFVDAGALAALEARGHLVLPSAGAMALVQDKLRQKEALAAAGVPIPRLSAASTPADVVAAGEAWGWPLLLKARRNGYDGKGNVTVRSAAEVQAGWDRLGGGTGGGLFVEEYCDFTAELALIVVRGRNGESARYPVVETVQRNHVCHLVRVPAAVPDGIADRAADLAERAVEATGLVGAVGVEMFLLPDGRIVLNELAPRVHNSGHYTIEGCETSQFENHVRAVLGWPLGSTRLLAPAAVMVNLLGAHRSPGRPVGLEQALAVPGAHVHLYGKAMSGPGRKMGHVTAVGADLAEVEARASRAAAAIHFGEATS